MNLTANRPAAEPLFPKSSKFLEPDLDGEMINDAIATTQVHLAYERLPLSALMTVVTVVLFTILLVPFFPLQLTLGWAGVMTIIATGRYLLWRAYNNTLAAGRAQKKWDVGFIVSAWVAGAGWALGPVTMMPQAGHVESMLLMGTVLCVASVATLSLTPRLPAYLAFLAAILLPTVYALYRTGGAVESMAALLVGTGFVALVQAGRALNANTRKSIESEIQLSRSVAQIDKERQRAEAASMAKTRFLANISHELRTPLNAVIGAAQLLRPSRGDVESQMQMVEAIQKSGSNLLELIEGILDLSRIEVGELKLLAEDFHLLDCIEAALATAALTARAKGLELACIVQPEVVIWRHGDSARLRQLLLNLLGNAVKFTPKGEILLHIERGAQDEDLRISVSDTGVGIGAASLPHIFEPFRQADDAANRRFSGSGLGLSIVHQLVQAMGGTSACTASWAEARVLTSNCACRWPSQCPRHLNPWICRSPTTSRMDPAPRRWPHNYSAWAATGSRFSTASSCASGSADCQSRARQLGYWWQATVRRPAHCSKAHWTGSIPSASSA